MIISSIEALVILERKMFLLNQPEVTYGDSIYTVERQVKNQYSELQNHSKQIYRLILDEQSVL